MNHFHPIELLDYTLVPQIFTNNGNVSVSQVPPSIEYLTQYIYSHKAFKCQKKFVLMPSNILQGIHDLHNTAPYSPFVVLGYLQKNTMHQLEIFLTCRNI